MLRSAHSPIRQIVFDFCLRRVGYPLFPLRSPKGAHCEEDVSTKSRRASMLEPLLGIGGTASLSCFAPQNKKRAPREQSTHVSPPSEPAFGFKLRQASGLRFSGGIPKHLCYPSGFAERRCRPATLLHTGARKPRALTLYEPTASSGRHFEPAPRYTDEHGVSPKVHRILQEQNRNMLARFKRVRQTVQFCERGALSSARQERTHGSGINLL